MKKLIRFFACVFFPFLTIVAPSRAGDAPSLQQVIRQLGNDRFAEREKATRRLLVLEEIPPELREAIKSPDLEVRRRVADIIRQIETRRASVGLDAARRLARVGQFDEAIEHIVRWAESDREGTSLQSLSHLAGELIELENRRFGITKIGQLIEKDMVPNLNVDHFTQLTSRESLVYQVKPIPQPGEDSLRGRLSLRGRGVNVTGERISALIVSSDIVSIKNCDLFGCSVIFTTGNVELELRRTGIGLLIVSDGDVSIRGEHLNQSLIIARGNVTFPLTVYRSTICAGGSIKQPSAKAVCLESVIREHDLDGLGLIKFFDPKLAGIEVVAGEKKGVKVKTVAKNKPFAAGLRTGDIIMAVDGKPISSPDVFRKVLRATLAEERSKLTFLVLRSGESKKVLIPMKR